MLSSVCVPIVACATAPPPDNVPPLSISHLFCRTFSRSSDDCDSFLRLWFFQALGVIVGRCACVVVLLGWDDPGDDLFVGIPC